jgi:predicted nucleic acid-binding protein
MERLLLDTNIYISDIIEHDILSLAKVIKVFSCLEIITKDPSDNAILACALDGKADLIVTGDNHLLKLKKYKNIQILTSAEFLRKV